MGQANGKFTPTQARILAVLSDGLPHTPEELVGCLWDEMTSVKTVRVHIHAIRKILRPAGQDIVCEYIRRDCLYRHVRLLNFRE